MATAMKEGLFEHRLSTSSSIDDASLDDDAGLLSRRRRRRTVTRNKLDTITIISYICVAVLWILSLLFVRKVTQDQCPRDGFAHGFDTDLEPLRSVLQVERVRFTGSLDIDENGTLYRTSEPGTPQYVGKPNPEIDANWENLLEVDGVDLMGEEAASIIGSTFQKPGGWSLVGIDGFHQIHCVNMLYKNMHQDYYSFKDSPDILEVHLHHCIDYLRQAIMCNLDVTPMMVEWTTKWNRLIDHFDNPHTCRNFDKVKAWMLERSGLKHPMPKIGHPWVEPLPGVGVREGY